MSNGGWLLRFAFAACLGASGAQASSLQVSPVSLEVPAPGSATVLTLRNSGASPLSAQIRVFRWTQSEGRDVYAPTQDVVASPPQALLRPGANYTVRLVRVAGGPPSGGEDAGAPGVPVLFENRPIGKTGADGKLLAPNLRSWQRNALAIDSTALPVDAQTNDTQRTVRPGDRQGVVVDFGVRTHARAAVVILVDERGAPLPAGAAAARTGAEGAARIGYDGRLFLSDLASENEVTAETNAGPCVARFSWRPRPGAQQTIGPVVCRQQQALAANMELRR